MASSSVSQDDLVDNDFEKSNRRSRIRTARARQINTGGSCLATASAAARDRLESVHDIDNQEEHNEGGVGGLQGEVGGVGSGVVASSGGIGAGSDSVTGQAADAAHQAVDSAATSSTVVVGVSGDVSPKSRSGKAGASTAASSVSTSAPVAAQPTSKSRSLMSKAALQGLQHHGPGMKGKGAARDRRKLREKRRSTGVVHLASTESTGGSTTGDDEESSDAAVQGAGVAVCAETKRNTQHNEALISNSYKRARDKLAMSDDDDSGAAGGDEAIRSGGDSGPSSASLLMQSTGIHLRGAGGSGVGGVGGGAVSSVSGGRRGVKSPSDLEADDEKDHDSLNQSGASGAGSNNHLPGLLAGSSSGGGGGILAAAATGGGDMSTNSSTKPAVRPTTPTSGTTDAASSSHPPSSASLNPVQVERVEAENKRLLSLMEEKDRKIDLLEFKITQLMKDTRSVTEEQARLHKENTTLLRALSNITKQQEQDKMPPGK